MWDGGGGASSDILLGGGGGGVPWWGEPGDAIRIAEHDAEPVEDLRGEELPCLGDDLFFGEPCQTAVVLDRVEPLQQTLQVGLAREDLDFVGLELFPPFPGGELLGVVGGVLERAVTLFEVDVSVVVRVSTISRLVGTAIVMGWCWSVLL